MGVTSHLDEPSESIDEAERPLGRTEFFVRVSWIALRLILVVWLAERGQSFVYQGF